MLLALNLITFVTPCSATVFRLWHSKYGGILSTTVLIVCLSFLRKSIGRLLVMKRLTFILLFSLLLAPQQSVACGTANMTVYQRPRRIVRLRYFSVNQCAVDKKALLTLTAPGHDTV